MAKVRKRGKSYQIDYFDPDGKLVRMSFKRKKDAAIEIKPKTWKKQYRLVKRTYLEAR